MDLGEIAAAPRAQADLRRSRITGESPRRLWLTTHQQIERDEVRDHQQRYVDDRDRVCGTQLPRHCRKADPSRVVIVDDDVGHPHYIEGEHEKPEERTYPDREQRQDSQPSGYEVT